MSGWYTNPPGGEIVQNTHTHAGIYYGCGTELRDPGKVPEAKYVRPNSREVQWTFSRNLSAAAQENSIRKYPLNRDKVHSNLRLQLRVQLRQSNLRSALPPY